MPLFHGPRYAPPYDSPIEDVFAWNVVKYLSPDVVLLRQRAVSTPYGEFKLDFTLALGNREIGVECDGKEFHQGTRDEWRDAFIFRHSQIEAIYRIGGKEINYAIERVLQLLSKDIPEFFSKRGIEHLARLVAFANKPLDEETPNGPSMRPFYLNRESRSDSRWFETLLNFADSRPWLTSIAELSLAFSEHLQARTDDEPPF